jgi:hypothetical protein
MNADEDGSFIHIRPSITFLRKTFTITRIDILTRQGPPLSNVHVVRLLSSPNTAFWGHHHRTQREMLSAMVGGFDKDVLEEFYDLTPDQFARLLNLYSAEYGEGAEKKRGEIKYENAAKDIANFVANADLMDQRKTDYQMSGQFESASGMTKIQVGRNWTQTIVIGGVILLVLLVVAIYLLKL